MFLFIVLAKKKDAIHGMFDSLKMTQQSVDMARKLLTSNSRQLLQL